MFWCGVVFHIIKLWVTDNKPLLWPNTFPNKYEAHNESYPMHSYCNSSCDPFFHATHLIQVFETRKALSGSLFFHTKSPTAPFALGRPFLVQICFNYRTLYNQYTLACIVGAFNFRLLNRSHGRYSSKDFSDLFKNNFWVRQLRFNLKMLDSSWFRIGPPPFPLT